MAWNLWGSKFCLNHYCMLRLWEMLNFTWCFDAMELLGSLIGSCFDTLPHEWLQIFQLCCMISFKVSIRCQAQFDGIICWRQRYYSTWKAMQIHPSTNQRPPSGAGSMRDHQRHQWNVSGAWEGPADPRHDEPAPMCLTREACGLSMGSRTNGRRAAGGSATHGKRAAVK